MQFLRTAFWVAIAIVIVVFAVNNWTPVTVNLWDGLRMDTKLPVLVIGAFLLGLLPLWLFHRAMCWRWRRRLDTVERALSNGAVTPSPPPRAILPSAAPAAVPPGVV
jgi:lipopolysaccharide assembly protein A